MIADKRVRTKISWLHKKLNHVGQEDNLISTMSRILYHPQLHKKIECFVQGRETFQKHRLLGRGYGHLSPREALVLLWLANNKTLKIHALTMIDTTVVMNLVEMQLVGTISAKDAAKTFEIWLFNFTRSVIVIHDQGTKFMGDNFQALLCQLVVI